MDMPIAHDHAIDTDGTNPVVVHVLANDFSLNSPLDPASVAIVSSPSHGSVSRNAATGDVTYTANMGFAGTDTFKYTVKDQNGDLSNQATVSVVINRPTANDDFIDTDGTNPVAIDVLANDTDPDGNNQIDPSSVAIASSPAHGTVQVNSTTGQVTYTAFAGFGGSDTFTYTVRDFPGATSNPGKVTVVVNRPKANDDFIDTDGANSRRHQRAGQRHRPGRQQPDRSDQRGHRQQPRPRQRAGQPDDRSGHLHGECRFWRLGQLYLHDQGLPGRDVGPRHRDRRRAPAHGQ